MASSERREKGRWRGLEEEEEEVGLKERSLGVWVEEEEEERKREEEKKEIDGDDDVVSDIVQDRKSVV